MSDDRKLSDIGNELHNLSCHVVHHNEDWANQLGALAYELWNWNTRAQACQGGESVEVVGYGCEGQMEVLKHVPLTGGMKVSGREREKYSVPLMTVAQHQRILADVRANRAAVLKVMQARKLLPKCEPSPDAELVRQCIAEELAEWEGDYKFAATVALNSLSKRLDAKLASLEVKP